MTSARWQRSVDTAPVTVLATKPTRVGGWCISFVPRRVCTPVAPQRLRTELADRQLPFVYTDHAIDN